jgi:hypothetical protein
MLINRTVSVSGTAVDLVGSGVDLDRPYEVIVTCIDGSAYIGDSGVTPSNGLPLLPPGATRANIVFRVGDHGDRLFVIGDGAADVRVLVIGL